MFRSRCNVALAWLATCGVAMGILSGLLPGAAGLAGVGCIDDSARPDRDAVGDAGDVAAGPRCDGDGDCTKFGNACNVSVCVDRACVSEPVQCDDDNVCTNDRCDETRGCVFEPRAAGSDCAVGDSAVCVGSTWHAADACDDAGRCVDGEVEACLVGIGTGFACRHNECVAGVGCAVVADTDGASCVAEGRSDVCVDAVRYEPDACAAGMCVDAGSQSCPAGFCEVATCDGKGCGAEQIGVDIDLTGAWNLFTLYDDGAGVVSTRIGIVLGAAGDVVIQGVLGPNGTSKPDNGNYCVATDGRIQLGLHFPDDRELILTGRVTRGRDLALMTPEGLGGMAVMVKNRETSEARLFGGSYRIVGLDNAVVGDETRVDSLLGTIAFADKCVTGGSYGLGNQPTNVAIQVPNPPSCVEFGGVNSISFDVRAAGDVRVWAGVVGTGGNYAVLQRFRVGERVVEPSLVFLVRIGLAAPFALDGDYAMARVAIEGADASISRSSISFDGLGRITSFSEGDAVLGPADVGTVTVSTNDPISGFLTTLRIGSETRQRVGQLGQATSSKVDWFVDVGTLPDLGGITGPVSGRTLQLGVRQP